MRRTVALFMVVPHLSGGGVWPDFMKNHGILTNMTAANWVKADRPGGFGMALDFTSPDHVLCGSLSALDNLGPLTYAIWVKADTHPFTVTRMINKGNDDGFTLRDHGGSGQTNTFRFEREYATENLVRVPAAGLVPTGEWVLLMVTWDGSATAANATMYKNGEEVASYLETTDGVGAIVADEGNDLILGNRGAADRGLDGQTDYIHIWNRVLTRTEARFIYTDSILGNPGILNYETFAAPSEQAAAVAGFVHSQGVLIG